METSSGSGTTFAHGADMYSANAALPCYTRHKVCSTLVSEAYGAVGTAVSTYDRDLASDAESARLVLLVGQHVLADRQRDDRARRLAPEGLRRRRDGEGNESGAVGGVEPVDACVLDLHVGVKMSVLEKRSR